jgi:hypothetical protein
MQSAKPANRFLVVPGMRMVLGWEPTSFFYNTIRSFLPIMDYKGKSLTDTIQQRP